MSEVDAVELAEGQNNGTVGWDGGWLRHCSLFIARIRRPRPVQMTHHFPQEKADEITSNMSAHEIAQDHSSSAKPRRKNPREESAGTSTVTLVLPSSSATQRIRIIHSPSNDGVHRIS